MTFPLHLSTIEVPLYADNLVIWAFPQTLSVQLQPSRLSSTNWWSGPLSDVYLNLLKCESSFISLDPYQYRHKPFLSILNTPLNFNPNPSFSDVTFDRIISFKHHVLSLRKKFYNRFYASRLSLYSPHSYLCFPRLVLSRLPPISPQFLASL